MNRRRSLLISAISAILAGCIVYGVYRLQLKQIELQQTVQVAVPVDFIRAGTYVTADMVALKAVQQGSVTEDMITDLSEVVDKETVLPLGKQEPILRWKMNRYHLLPGERESTFQIPKEYVLSVSNGIRAGDRVRVYLSSSEGSRRLFEQEITVASVKTASNVEIDNPKNSNLLSKAEGDAEKMYVSRLEANGPIDQINLNLTEEEWLDIDRLCSGKKAKLVIAFSSSSILSAP
ncbi:CpaB family protein [Paenibacillus hexagrammi]|uniref:Flagellar biosynthesis protein FlgA n=1 Tax=Paenibacillus hexagrammi TaxID=2908839 RepID=A0ABY3SEX9_9BACL|nr:flagellar biosynthesis protein FlgA [Paenibacillus sp. YPD9-1]UJF32549.1 flagellar biosynthesis protein FlgA [Paenibacillus sp. YPD9-1]